MLLQGDMRRAEGYGAAFVRMRNPLMRNVLDMRAGGVRMVLQVQRPSFEARTRSRCQLDMCPHATRATGDDEPVNRKELRSGERCRVP